MKRFICTSAILFGLSACGDTTLVDKFKEYQAKGEEAAAPAVSEVVAYRCNFMSTTDRRVLLAAVNSDLASKGSVNRATALDCDGDGSPDPL